VRLLKLKSERSAINRHPTGQPGGKPSWLLNRLSHVAPRFVDLRLNNCYMNMLNQFANRPLPEEIPLGRSTTILIRAEGVRGNPFCEFRAK